MINKNNYFFAGLCINVSAYERDLKVIILKYFTRIGKI